MVIAMWIVIPILFYIFMAGMLKAPFAKSLKGKCKKCHGGQHRWIDKSGYRDTGREMNSITYHENDGAAMAALWPFTLPWTIGSLITSSDRADNKKNKTEARRVNE